MLRGSCAEQEPPPRSNTCGRGSCTKRCSAAPRPDLLSAPGPDSPLTQKKSRIIPEKPQSSERSGQQSLLFLCLSLYYLCPPGATLLPAIYNVICLFSMSASFFLGTNTRAPSAAETHSNACVLPMEEEGKDGRGARTGTGAGERGGG